MSYRDLRNFTEALRTLGYPRHVSVDNFRTPNFPLVAEILVWLIKQFDENSLIPTDVDEESDRVLFIKAVVDFLATKLHMRLNPKKLYGADGFAVREMNKVVQMLYDAQRQQTGANEEDQEEVITADSFDISGKRGVLKQARQLAQDITRRGAQLYQLLAEEGDLREERLDAIGRGINIEEIERGIRQGIQSLGSQSDKIKRTMENLASDEANLEAKIEKKKVDLERSSKRLKSLQNVRPAFMDEYEKLEQELEQVYNTYIEKYRNLQFLEQRLEDHNRQEQERAEETEQMLRRMQEKLQEDEMRQMMGQDDELPFQDDEEDLIDDDDGLEESGDDSAELDRRDPVAYGSMGGGLGAGEEDEEEDDDLYSDEDEDDLDDSDLDLDDEEGGGLGGLGDTGAALGSEGSDDDF